MPPHHRCRMKQRCGPPADAALNLFCADAKDVNGIVALAFDINVRLVVVDVEITILA